MRLLTTNLCTQAATTITASSENPNFPASNLQNPLRSKRWRATGCSSETLVFDFQTTEDVNSVVVMWPREDGVRLTGAATITIQANATNVWTSPSVSQTITVDNTYGIASHFFSTDQSYRFWRLKVEDATNPWGYIEIGQVWIGKDIGIPSAQNGFGFNLVDRTKTFTNAFGNRYFDEYPQLAVLEFSYLNMAYSDIQTLENAFRENGCREPIIVALDPLASVFDKDHFLVYGMFDESFQLRHVYYNIFSTGNLKVEELA